MRMTLICMRRRPQINIIFIFVVVFVFVLIFVFVFEFDCRFFSPSLSLSFYLHLYFTGTCASLQRPLSPGTRLSFHPTVHLHYLPCHAAVVLVACKILTKYLLNIFHFLSKCREQRQRQRQRLSQRPQRSFPFAFIDA